MESNYWNKSEKEIFDQHFLTLKWEELLDLLPNKTETQILKRGTKLGLGRENEKQKVYYDDQEEAWVEEVKMYFNNSISNTKILYPAPKGVTFEECQEAFGKHLNNSFYDRYVKTQYQDFLNKSGAEHNKELFDFFWDLRMNAYLGEKMPNYDERIKRVKTIIKEQKTNS